MSTHLHASHNVPGDNVCRTECGLACGTPDETLFRSLHSLDEVTCPDCAEDPNGSARRARQAWYRG